MNMLAGAAAGAKKAAAEKAISTVETQFGALLPYCGGPMGTLKAFEFVVPADKKDEFQSGYSQYESAKKELASM